MVFTLTITTSSSSRLTAGGAAIAVVKMDAAARVVNNLENCIAKVLELLRSVL